MRPRYYAGVGSRETPKDILVAMRRLAGELYDLNYVLRSGGADGADTAFEEGHKEAARAVCASVNKDSGIDCGACPAEACGFLRSEIYLPWPGFNGVVGGIVPTSGWLAAAIDMAAKYHPNWAACSPGARKLHARNCFQVLGLDLKTPSDFVVCWTKGAEGGGGTGQAIRIARDKGVPVFDLAECDPQVVLTFARRKT